MVARKQSEEAPAQEEEVVPPALVKIAVERGIRDIGISVGGDAPRWYREVDGVIEVPPDQVELVLQHVGGSSLLEPAIPVEENH